MNERALKFILRRDAPKGTKLVCLFCGEKFETGKIGGGRMVFDHLDNNSRNNNYANLALVHQRCNQRKRTYGDYQLIALEKMRVNAAYVPPLPAGPDQRENENVRIGHTISNFVKEYLEVNCPAGALLNFNDAANDVSYLLQQKFAVGSPATAKRHLGVFTCNAAPWSLVEIDGKRMIVKKVEAGGGDDDD